PTGVLISLYSIQIRVTSSYGTKKEIWHFPSKSVVQLSSNVSMIVYGAPPTWAGSTSRNSTWTTAPGSGSPTGTSAWMIWPTSVSKRMVVSAGSHSPDQLMRSGSGGGMCGGSSSPGPG